MRRLFPIVWIFPFIHFGMSLAADEGRGKKQPVSDLIEQLGDKDPDKVCAAARALGNRQPTKDAAPALKRLLKSPDGRVKWTAAEALYRLKHTATDLVPVYAELLTATGPDVRAASAWRLGRLGSDARPAVAVLAAALRDESLEVRVQVGQALANLGDLAEPALPALVRALGHHQLDEDSQRDETAESVRQSPALPAIVELGDKAIPLLIESFRERPGKRRREDLFAARDNLAARAAHAFPAFGLRAVPPLLRALEAKDADTRRYAAGALGEAAQFSELPHDAVDKLEACLDDPDKGVRAIAAGALSWARPASTKAVTILAKSREEGLGLGDRALLAHLERMCPHNQPARRLLLRMLGAEREETAQEAHRILAGLGLPADQVLGVWTKALSHADQKVRYEATSAFAKLGPSAKSAKSTLHQRFTKEPDVDCKGGILDALIVIDPDDPALVPLLSRSLDDRQSWVRYRALNCIAALGPRAKDLLPRLEASLLSPKAQGDEDVLESSKMRDLVSAIVRIAPGSTRTAATLLKALRHRGIRAVRGFKNSWHMRDRLEDELHATLPRARPLLCEALKDKDAEVRRSAALVLLRAGLDTGTALPVLMENLWGGKDTGDELSRFQRRVVVELLSRRQGPATGTVAAAWCKAWQTAHPEERTTLKSGLLVLQPEALPHLLKQLREATTSERRRDLAHLLARFEGQSKAVLPILRKDLRGSKLADQYTAAQALILLGPDAAETVQELVKLLSSSHPAIRVVAAKALSGVGRAAKPAVPALKAMLRGPTPEMRIVAASALGQIDPTVSEALVVLRDALISAKGEEPIRMVMESDLPEGVKGDPVFPDSVEESITRFGQHAVPVLADILDNVDLDEWSADNVSSQCGAHVRVRAALLLAELGPDAQQAVPALIRALSDRDPFIRDAAASALGRIGPAAKEAAPACITLFEQQNRLAPAGGTWDTTSRAGGRSRAASHLGYGGPFDFRSLGRGRAISSYNMFGYGFGGDAYSHVRPAYPFDAPHVLSRIDSKAYSALPVLAEVAKSHHPARLSAGLSIWRSGRESPDLMPAFTAVLRNHAGTAKEASVPLPREVRECLVELGTELRPALGVMTEWLKQRQSSAEENDLIAVVEALGHLGADARAAAGLLRPMLQGNRWNARRRVAAALALFRILGNGDSAFPVLREVLLGVEEHPSLYHWPDLSDTARARAARALGVLTEKGDVRAGALLVEAAKGDENPHVRVVALEALARQKETNLAAVRGLCAVLRHQDASVRLAAAAACGRLGTLAKASAKALTVATEDSRIAVRQAARQALDALD